MNIATNPEMKSEVIKLMKQQFGNMPLFFLTKQWESGRITSMIALGDHKKNSSIEKSIAFINSVKVPDDQEEKFETPERINKKINFYDIAKPNRLSKYFADQSGLYKAHESLIVSQYYSIEKDYYLCIPCKDKKDNIIGFFFPILRADQIDQIDISFILALMKVL